MRGKKAKAMRKGARLLCTYKDISLETVYREQKHPRLYPKIDKVTREIVLKEDDTPETVTINRITRWLGDCSRRIYQLTKRKYNGKL